MHLEGTHFFSAAQQSLWKLLNDPEVLARATPGIKALHPRSEDRYRALFEIKMGPINSRFEGTLSVMDKVAPQRYRLLVEVEGRIGAVAAEGAIELLPEEEGTRVAFAGDARLSGVLARMGQRVLSGVGRMFTRQFFKALEEEIPQG